MEFSQVEKMELILQWVFNLILKILRLIILKEAGLPLIQTASCSKELTYYSLGGGKNVNTNRDKQAIFFETNTNFIEKLDLILSGRYEKLENESSFDPKFSFRYLASDRLLLRGSIGTSFTSPSMAQMFSSEIQLGSVRDINSSPFVRLALLGNPNLKPATSENINLGFIWNISDAVDLTLDYWAINYKNRIEVESAQVLLNNNPFGATHYKKSVWGINCCEHLIF